MCCCKKFDVPGVEFSRLESGLEIISVTNKYASAKITTNGAHIFEFIPAGERDLLWVSKKAYMEPGKPIRGGVPVCWPWFGASLKEGWPGHGFIRKEEWEVAEISQLPSGATKLVFKIDSDMKEYAMSEFPFTVYMVFTVGKELEIRKYLSKSHLYSSAFVPRKEDGKFVLYGAGWGHGVGLCQIGAAVMGAKGFKYDEILLHYFIGATINKNY